MKGICFVLAFWLFTAHISAFQPTSLSIFQSSGAQLRVRRTAVFLKVDRDNSIEGSELCWNPKLRRVMGLVASAGMIETAYLTLTKLTDKVDILCGADGGCSSILNGPYAFIPGTNIPLSLLGFVAYATVAFLAVEPIRTNEENDQSNRVLLTTATTIMGVFSVFLMSILFGVLHESCPYCIASAVFSIVLAKLAWLGGALPQERVKEGVATSAGGALAAFAAATVFYVNINNNINQPSSQVNFAGNFFGKPTLLADASGASSKQLLYEPPTVSTVSSERALALSSQLQALDTKMYGAYWCSHCYDQKELLGVQAMAKIPYIECSKDGVNSQTKACKTRDVPGYPTWEINGRLFPGEREIDELEDIVRQVKVEQTK